MQNNNQDIILPLYIQDSIIKQVYTQDKKDAIKIISLVCWRWFEYLSGLVIPHRSLEPMSSLNVLKDMYKHTKNKCCLVKGITEIKSTFYCEPFQVKHTRKMKQNFEWIKSFYGNVTSLSIQLGENNPMRFYQQLFGKMLWRAERYHIKKHKKEMESIPEHVKLDMERQKQVRRLLDLSISTDDGDEDVTTNITTGEDVEEIKKEKGDSYGYKNRKVHSDNFKIIKLQTLTIQAVSYDTIPLMPKYLELVGPYCHYLNRAHIYLEKCEELDFIITFLNNTKTLKDLCLYLKFSKPYGQIIIPKIFDALPQCIEYLQFSVENHVIPFHILSKYKQLTRIGMNVNDCIPQFLDFILSNETINNLDGTVVEYTSESARLFYSKESITSFSISFEKTQGAEVNTFHYQLLHSEYPDIRLHAAITILNLKFDEFSPNIIRVITKQCPLLHTLDLAALAIGTGLLGSLTEFIRGNSVISNIYLDALNVDDQRTMDAQSSISQSEFLEFYEAVVSSNITYVLLMFSKSITLNYPYPKPEFQGWSINIDEKFFSIDMYPV